MIAWKCCKEIANHDVETTFVAYLTVQLPHRLNTIPFASYKHTCTMYLSSRYCENVDVGDPDHIGRTNTNCLINGFESPDVFAARLGQCNTFACATMTKPLQASDASNTFTLLLVLCHKTVVANRQVVQLCVFQCNRMRSYSR